MRGLPAVALGLLCAHGRAQELLWEVHPVSGVQYGGCYESFGDYDHDGSDDLLVGGRDYGGAYPLAILRVLSGVDGSILAEMYHPLNSGAFTADVGDFDGDSIPDVTIGMNTFIDVWSIARGISLAHIPVPPNTSGPYLGALCAPDCDGDGSKDVVYNTPNGTIWAFSHFGVLLYTIPAPALGFIPSDMAVVGDLDGDGADDYVVGAVEWFTGQVFGAAILVSGRTGTVLRIHWGELPGDGINKDVRAAGDVDGDGVMDYAAGNAGGQRGLILIWSGATGALIRQWVDTNNPHLLGGAFLAGRDVDLDGRPDIIGIVGGYPNTPGQTTNQGRVRTLSSRDGQSLVYVASQQWTGSYGDTYADLGVQPGNPYPVFAVSDTPIVPPYNGWPRIRVYRCSPAGTQFTGTGCSSTGATPTIGIRRVDGTTTDASRLVLGSAPANALAICVVAPATLSATPFPLDVLGMVGCHLLVPPVLLEARVTGSAGMDRGYAAFDFASTMSATNGTRFAAQWIVLDPASLAHAATQRLEFRVQ